jgi:hypothetical protein
MQIEEIKVQAFPDGRMDVLNAAKYTGFSKSSLDKWRSVGDGGPQYVERNSRIFYYKDDLDAWLNEGGRVQGSVKARLKRNL